ncbi:hypothetical protein AB8E26_05070 [Stenotrophomonas rhizophila]|uniref:hypothetical protein n=1 Tax=Stenotrophomonas rhizophila TaxID=216778 RepID=UPI0035147149
MPWLRLAGLSLVLLSAACSRQSVSMALPSDIDPAELKQRLQKPVQVAGTSGARMVLSPGHVGACSGWETATSKITWTVDPTKVQSTRVEVGDKRQVFAAGGASGEGVAEGWFSAGVTFHLVDATSNSDLLTYTVEAIDCAQR